MRTKILAICFILSLFLLNGCPPPAPGNSADTANCGATNLNVDVSDNAMDVSWVNNCEKNISGYFIYISENSNSANTPFNLTPYDGDTNPEDGIEYFKAESLENGKKYYVSVRIINPDKSLSQNTEEFVVVCGPREEIELSVRYKSDQDGYSFNQNKYVRADKLENDLYFYSKDGKDYISSPHKLDGFLKNNKLAKLSYKGDFQGLRKQIEKYAKKPSEDNLIVSKDNWIQITTADNTNALVKILGFSGSGETRKVKLFVAYAPIVNELIF